VNSPRWKIEAASTASASPSRAPSTRCCRVPTPPDAITGTGQFPATCRVSSRSKPSRVPSRSIEASRISPAPPAMGVALPPEDVVPARLRAPPAGIDGDHHALAPELVGQFGDEIRSVDGSRVDPHLVRPRPEQLPGVLDGADPSADGEGDEDHLSG